MANGKDAIKEFIISGKMAEDKGLFISATDNYFKALVIAVDIQLYSTLSLVPKSHTERFRILEKENQELYNLIDKLFSIYRKSYRSIITKDELEKIKNGLKKTLELTRLEKEFIKYLQEE